MNRLLAKSHLDSPIDGPCRISAAECRWQRALVAPSWPTSVDGNYVANLLCMADAKHVRASGYLGRAHEHLLHARRNVRTWQKYFHLEAIYKFERIDRRTRSGLTAALDIATSQPDNLTID